MISGHSAVIKSDGNDDLIHAFQFRVDGSGFGIDAHRVFTFAEPENNIDGVGTHHREAQSAGFSHVRPPGRGGETAGSRRQGEGFRHDEEKVEDFTDITVHDAPFGFLHGGEKA